MITGTAALSASGGTVAATLLIGPVDAPYDVLAWLLSGGNLGLAAASFSLTSSAANGGAWCTVSDDLVRKIHLEEGDSLYGAVWNGSAVLSFIGNPAS